MTDALGRRDAKGKFLNKRRASDLEKLNRVHENGGQCDGQQRERVNYIENEEIVVLPMKHNEDSDQTGLAPRLICMLAGHVFVGFYRVLAQF